jgi:hypothetical protein
MYSFVFSWDWYFLPNFYSCYCGTDECNDNWRVKRQEGRGKREEERVKSRSFSFDLKRIPKQDNAQKSKQSFNKQNGRQRSIGKSGAPSKKFLKTLKPVYGTG